MYDFILAPLLAWIVALVLKFILKNQYQNLKFRDFFAYSNMPSGHTALVVALTSIILFKEGFASPLFAIAAVFASIVITDAVGLRTYLGQHGKTLNILVEDLKEDDFIEDNYPKLLEKIGHTQMEVLVGGLIGLGASLIIFLIK